MPGMTDRDHFAAAALTGLIASREWPIDSDEAAHYCYRVADAMLRERGKSDYQKNVEWLAPFANHDAAPAAIVPEPEPSAARRRPAGGTGGTDHGASPEARASVESVAPQPTTRGESDRNDKAAPRPSEGTGDTPATHATPGEGSERRECTEPVAWGVANGSRVLATSISRMDAVDMQGDYAYHTEIVPLYREPTLTDAEREAIYRASQYLSQNDVFEGMAEDAATLRGLLERIK